MLLYPLSILLGYYRHFAAHHPPTLTLLTPHGTVNPLAASPALVEKLPISFAEDALHVPGQDAVIFSADAGRAIYNPFSGEGDFNASPGGTLIWYDLNDGTQRPLSFENWPQGRRMHQLGIAMKGDLLAIANLASGGDAPGIEILRLEGTTAHWIRTISGPDVTTPNSVVLVNERQVLVTNSYGFTPHKHPLLAKLETFLGLPLGYVWRLTVREDGSVESKAVSERLAMANGMALSDDGRLLAVAGSVGMEVQVYDVSPPITDDASKSAITYRETLPLGYTVDNVHFLSTGANHTFLAAGHPSAMEYFQTAAAKGEGKLAGSRVVKFTVEKARKRDTAEEARAEMNRLFTKRDKRVEVVLEDSGEYIGTSSTALPIGGNSMLVMGLWDRGVVRARDVDLSPVQAK